jgi:hypothetical protein
MFVDLQLVLLSLVFAFSQEKQGLTLSINCSKVIFSFKLLWNFCIEVLRDRLERQDS